MADYYPLIARAVLALKDARAEERAPVYERARNALVNHLKAIDPPVSTDALAAEEQALDEAIARVEAEILSGDVPGQDPGPPPRVHAEPVVAAAAAKAPPMPQVADAPAVSTATRPSAPSARTSVGAAAPTRRRAAMTIAVVATLAALGIAALAYATRTDPTVMARNDPIPAQPITPVQPQPNKSGERVGDAGSAPAQPDAAAVPPTPTPPPLAVAQRAILYEEQPDQPGKPVEVTGRAIWRLDTVSVGAGQPPETVIRIDLDFPERSFGTEMTIRRNLEPALSASHLIEIKFNFRAGGGSVRELATPPQLKQEENQRGSPLIALQVPVMDNFFLVGLSKLPADVERNISLLESANWIDLPVRFANGRLAVIAFEKGTNGADVLGAALVRWRS